MPGEIKAAVKSKVKKIKEPKAPKEKKLQVKEPKAPKVPKVSKVKTVKPKMCPGSMPYATKGHDVADKDCISDACAFCCNKYGTSDDCEAHGDGSDADGSDADD